MVKLVGIDIETKEIVKGGRRTDLDILCVSIVDATGKVYFSEQWGSDTTYALNGQLKCMKNDFILTFHNGSYDVPILRSRGVHIPQNRPGEVRWHDTMALSYTLYPSEMQNHALGNLAELVNMEKSPKPPFQRYTEELRKYNCQDCKVTAAVGEYFLGILDEPSFSYYSDIELPYIERIIEMEQSGVYLDLEQMRLKRTEYEGYIEEVERQIFVMTGSTPGPTKKYNTRVFSHYEEKEIRKREGTSRIVRTPVYTGKHGDKYDHCEISFINLNSPAQVAEALIRQGWKPTSFTATKKPKCDAAILESLSDKYPLAELICRRNKYNVMMTKFFKPMEELQRDGRIFGSLNQFHTRTRRLSSSDPNMQNIPGRGERGADIRKMFIAPSGYKVVVGDLDRIELVVLAYYLETLFGASNYADALRAGKDIHDLNAKAWGIERKPAKNGIFCFIYGGGRDKFAQTIGCSKSDAAAIMAKMQDSTPELFDLREFMEEELLEGRGTCYDYFGGCIYVPEIMSSDHKVYASGLRKGTNYLIQGTAGSIFKYLQLRAQIALEAEELTSVVTQALVVHDEALYYVKEEYADRVAKLLTECYSDKMLLDTEEGGIPVSATFHAADNWYDAKGE